MPPNPPTPKQERYLRELCRDVLRRELTSFDLHAAYEHAGVSRAPKLLPHPLTRTHVGRLITWLVDTRNERRVATPEPEQDSDECLYCVFGCGLCDPELREDEPLQAGHCITTAIGVDYCDCPEHTRPSPGTLKV